MAAASWSRNFWGAVSPSLAWWRSFCRSSTKPMAPNTRANRNTTRWLCSPFCRSSHPAVSTAIPMPRMNISPPMVGVPCLERCQVGPSSRMDWPAFSRRSTGIRICPAMAVTPNATIKLRMYVILSKPPGVLSLGYCGGSSALGQAYIILHRRVNCQPFPGTAPVFHVGLQYILDS